MEEGSDAAADTARPIGITKAKPAEEGKTKDICRTTT